MRKQKIGSLFLALSLTISSFSACTMPDFIQQFLPGESQETSLESSETHEHVFGTKLERDDEFHWYACECGEKKDVTQHVFEEPWRHNSSSHWLLCECGEKGSIAKHSGGEASCTEKADCAVCGKEYGKVSGHVYSDLKELETGEKGYACDCGDMIPLLAKDNEDGTRESGLLDFVVEVEADKDPVILQLSDTQFTDSQMEEKCFKYVRETVEATDPDLIIITGDLVYGRFDRYGNLFTKFIEFMEEFKIPWAPVFGNHDNECWLGVNWQCEQLEAAEYCLFEQGSVTGNGNYTVGIMQGNTLLRVFYMMDSNGCSRPAVFGDGNDSNLQHNTANNLGVVQTSAGFADNQVRWYQNSMNKIAAVSPATKLSMAYHIQQAYFIKAYDQYDYSSHIKTGSELKYALNLDAAKMINTETWTVEKELDVKEGDIGYLGRAMKGAWDTSFSIFSDMKNRGVDSIFVGHEHCNSISVVHNGVRFQYSQKSSTYDRYNSLDKDGNIIGSYSNAGTPLIGGTAFYLSKEDGSIYSPYIYLYGDPLGTNPKK